MNGLLRAVVFCDIVSAYDEFSIVPLSQTHLKKRTIIHYVTLDTESGRRQSGAVVLSARIYQGTARSH